jgi:hypothetical protein
MDLRKTLVEIRLFVKKFYICERNNWWEKEYGVGVPFHIRFPRGEKYIDNNFTLVISLPEMKMRSGVLKQFLICQSFPSLWKLFQRIKETLTSIFPSLITLEPSLIINPSSLSLLKRLYLSLSLSHWISLSLSREAHSRTKTQTRIEAPLSLKRKHEAPSLPLSFALPLTETQTGSFYFEVETQSHEVQSLSHWFNNA